MRHTKFGFLAGTGGNRNGIGSHFHAMDAAGLPITIGSYDDYGVIEQVAALRRASGVRHNLIFRPTLYEQQNPTYAAEPNAAADERWQFVRSRIPAEFDRDLVWLVVDNEGQDHQDADGPLANRTVYDWAGWWGIYNARLARLAIRDGYRLLVNGWSAGTPHHDFWSHPANVAFLRLCHEHSDRIGIAVHEGTAPGAPDAPYAPVINDIGWISGRYRIALDVCDAHKLRYPRIFITEFAFKFDDVPDIEHGLAQIRHADQFYATDFAVGGICLWFLGSGHGGIANRLATYIAPLTEYALDRTVFDHQPPIWADGAPYPVDDDDDDDALAAAYRKIVHVVPQNTTQAEWHIAADRAFVGRNTLAFSADDAAGLLLLDDTGEGSHVVVYEADRPERWRNYDITAWFNQYGIPVQTGRFAPVEPAPDPDPPPPPQPARLWGIDVSHHQDPRRIDWERLKQTGCAFVIIRGGYGTEMDSRAYLHHQYATQYGMVRMPYWFIDRRWSGIDQGMAFGRFVNAFEWDGPAWFDVEVTSIPGIGAVTPSKEQVIGAYKGYFGTATLPAGNYTNKYSWETIMQGHDPRRDGCTGLLWLADWEAPDGTARPEKIPAPFEAAWLIQEAARVVPGYAAALDVNFFNGTLAELTAPALWRPAGGNCALGIHASADSYNMPGDSALLAAANFSAIKYLSSHRPEDILRCEQHIDGDRRLVRAFLSIDGTPLTPQAFVDRTLSDVHRTITMIGPADVWVELHNEPNLHDEGMFRLWQQPSDFATWIGAVARLYRAALPGVKLAFPGVAPVNAIPNVAVSDAAFLSACQAVISADFDALCLHTYWGAIGDTWQDALAYVRRYASMYPQHDIWISEASHKGQATPGEKAADYLAYHAALSAIPNVVGVTYFVLSASNPAWGWESGTGETWRPSMAATVGE